MMKDKMTVLCVKPGEKPKRIEIESSLDALQRAVGGYIEAVMTCSPHRRNGTTPSAAM